ncbi:unnamed protein product [Linum trigynum]|uniref:RNase H type-1 domain-containing protein n=1 Tax=Linum trigynum TaxID=586398 RepID=A0AAV2CIR1_9ROSI
MDSTAAVHLLSTTSPSNHQHASLVLAFRELQQRDWEIRITHIYREANFLADSLAHRGHILPIGSHVICPSDPEIARLRMFDNVGGFTVRFLNE